ncbi:MAG: helix-turn-helix transcriptional regulator [Rhodanobacteraceae bacterium]
MDVAQSEPGVSAVAAAIAEPARTRMLYCLMDGHARTGTELAIVAGVTASTASVHLARLAERRLVSVLKQGKHRYYRLESPRVAAALEALTVVAGSTRDRFVPHTPSRLRVARTCYDHMAGTLGVSLHDRLIERGWFVGTASQRSEYTLSESGMRSFTALGIDLDATRTQRRRFAYACLDWSERRPHLGGALAAELLKVACRRRWLVRDLDSRALRLTATGRRELRARFGLDESVLGAAPGRTG